MVQLLCAHRFIHRLFASILVHRRAISHRDGVSRSFFDPIEMQCREMLRKRLIYDLLFPFASKNQLKSDSVTSGLKLTAFSSNAWFEIYRWRCVETRVFNNNLKIKKCNLIRLFSRGKSSLEKITRVPKKPATFLCHFDIKIALVEELA